MQVKFNTAALLKALSTFANVSNTAAKTLRQAAVEAGFTTYEDARPVVLQWIETRYGVGTIASKSPRNKGELVLDRSAAQYEAAKKAEQRMREALIGDADADKAQSAKREELEIPAEIAALAAKLAKACNEYEEGKRLAAQAVAKAFAAK